MTLGLVSDALGRERAIRLVRDLIDAGGYINADGLAMRIVVALDGAAPDETELRSEDHVGEEQRDA